MIPATASKTVFGRLNAVVVLTLWASLSWVEAGMVVIPGGSGGDLGVQVSSIKERRFLRTFRQQYDFSCGSAALATLLTFHYGDRVTEQNVFKWMYEHGDQNKIRKVGFSMLDMKNYLASRGYRGEGYFVTLDQLARASTPAIVLIDMKGYKHFVVVKGTTAGRVLVGDSAAGVRIIPRQEFESIWKGLAFVAHPPAGQSRRNFNRIDEWRVHAIAPLGMAVQENELANTTFLLPGPGDAGK